MSRDPRSGDYSEPSTLHKYLYAGGDPINNADATGQNTTTMPPGGLSEKKPTGGLLEYALVTAFVTAAILDSQGGILGARGKQAKCNNIGQLADPDVDRDSSYVFTSAKIIFH